MKALGSILCCAILMMAAYPCRAQEASAGPSRALSDSELDQARGGFVVGGDLVFQFGATMRTFEDGALALQTQVNWTQEGQKIDQTVGEGVSALTQADATKALAPLDLKGATGTGAFTTAGGSTLVQSVSSGQIANLVLNTASNGSFVQQTDVTLTLPGFAATQSGIANTLTAMRLADEMASGAIRAAGH